jgi:hypothetical protein
MNIDELVCYSDSLHYVNLIKGLQVRYHIYALLLRDINGLLFQTNVYLYYTSRERNQCADFFAKFGASSDGGLLTHVFYPKDVCDLLKNDAMKIFFLCE